MPTKKPIVQIVLTEKYHKKLTAIAKQEDKSTSSQGAKIIEKFIDDYETQYGEIIIEENIND